MTSTLYPHASDAEVFSASNDPTHFYRHANVLYRNVKIDLPFATRAELENLLKAKGEPLPPCPRPSMSSADFGADPGVCR